MTTVPNIDSLSGKINDLSNFFAARNINVSTAKSTATLLTTWTKEIRVEIDVVVPKL